MNTARSHSRVWKDLENDMALVGVEKLPGRADVGDVPTAETLGTLARAVLSSSRHAESRELACVVLQLLARSKQQA